MRTLMAIGGAMDEENPALMREFIRRAGGDAARLVILPQASELAETGENYAARFRELGAGQVTVMDFHTREAAGTPQQVKLLRKASGIFITGGAQMRLAVLFGGTRLEPELMAAFQRGCLVGGTSAGAAILSKTMIANGRGGATPRDRMVQFSPGFGFSHHFIFDQHFRERDRLGRLIYAVSTNPGIVGVGIDENTAAVVEEDDVITVYGSGAVTIVDGSNISATDVAEVGRREAVAVAGLTVHVLTQKGTYRRKEHAAFLPGRDS
ncbi:MAG TPA: cyanophycinase [Anaerolineales bacterium]|jgi:cyanophycinase